MTILSEKVDKDGGVHLSGDGQFDSRGYSAYICRFSIMDVQSKLLVDFETSRKPRGGNSMILEKSGHELCLPRVIGDLQLLTGIDHPVLSFTTDRCVNLTQAMKNYPSIHHYYDSWHWIRDKSGYDMRSEMAVIHWNALQFEEAAGERKVIFKSPFFCKTKKKVIMKSRKSPAKNLWRDQVLNMTKSLFLNRSVQEPMDMEEEEIVTRAETEAEMYRQPGTSTAGL
ncbi:hypothetical protein GCK72_011485 [Caenorhabditis remanei]|uniref:Uncharacterized protein n=1 Tax=Caenorhabditis remanei TaxID=31234 RepID=A0A6A5H840_CAERE|nr:hypothetical protein GCK72_011485 [Caenorhabditis remanei]KAF1763219.1 hypothetical protein GCK72_011485 [Caenorhabditis remanei]